MKIDIDLDILHTLAFYAGILLLKLLVMPALVSRTRLCKKVFANPEDKAFVLSSEKAGEVSIKHTDQDIERLRRAHLNDLEQIIPFLFLAFLYCFSNAEACCAKALFQLFTVSRIGHTVFYCWAKKPWLRFGCCFVGWLVSLYMGVAVCWNFQQVF